MISAINYPLKKVMVCMLLFISVTNIAYAQDKNINQLRAKLTHNIPDTTRVELLRSISLQLQSIRPDSALIYASQGLELSRKIAYQKGEANCLNRLGVLLWKNGSYDTALSNLLASLKIREEIRDRVGQLNSLNDIGIIYFDQRDYKKAVNYQFKAKAIAEALHDQNRLGVILSNLGNSYRKAKLPDLAMKFEMQAYEIQRALKDEGHLANTVSILGDINDTIGNTALALDYYRLGRVYAENNKDQNQLADTYNSIGLLYKKARQTDSSIIYTTKALTAARTANYPEGIFNASSLLTQIYRAGNEHLELLYLKIADTAKDNMFNAEKIKEVQQLSFKEATRQQELINEKRRENEERIINLQLIGIVLFILVFFLSLLLLSKTRVHQKVIDFMSVLSLLLVFEFISLFIHPFVQHISNHMPVLELVMSVILASLLVPMHHNLTHWLHERLVHIRTHHHPHPDTPAPEAQAKPKPRQSKKSAG